MATGRVGGFIRQLCEAALPRDGVGRTDGQLLADYLGRRDEAALGALVRRHAPMVWGVCRRALRDHHDAEDAFQATFLVFVRKAASIRSRDLLANWLYGVARQTAAKARATLGKRKWRERQVTEMPERPAAAPDLGDDPQPLLDEELARLPDIYRVAVVLCELEGKTRREAARQLGVPGGRSRPGWPAAGRYWQGDCRGAGWRWRPSSRRVRQRRPCRLPWWRVRSGPRACSRRDRRRHAGSSPPRSPR